MRDEGIVDGVVLAASFGAREAALGGALAARVNERLAALDALGREARARELASLAAALQPPVRPEWDGPPRARALLAAVAPREVGARWLAAAGAPRRGFRLDDGLRATLRALAGRPPADAAVARAELGHGRAWLAAARGAVDGAAIDAFLEGAGAEESAAVRALGVTRGEARSVALAEARGGALAEARGGALAEAILRAAARHHGAARVRAAGAMALGAAGDSGGDATSLRWRRAGAELSRIVALREHATSGALQERTA